MSGTVLKSWDTIVALSSGRLPAGVAIVRFSGPKVRFVLETISGAVPAPRVATLTVIYDGAGAVLDRSLILFFPAPKSFTGEDVAELHLHGGRALVAAVLKVICALPECRLADAGEFTRRAFLNGRIDLLTAEATADLINAETEGQRRFAMFNSTGSQTQLYADWRSSLIHARAMIEADLDFSDEGDVPGSVADTVWLSVRSVADSIRVHVSGYDKAEIIRDGYRVVLLGAPNSGKSSLLNVLAKRDVAIVSDEPGTTRDALDVSLDLGGQKIILTDTAGIRPPGGKVEAIGIARSAERAVKADLVVFTEDISDPLPFDRPSDLKESLMVGTKLDLVAPSVSRHYDICLSTLTGRGVDELLNELNRRAQKATCLTSDILPWRERHLDLLSTAVTHLDRAVSGETAPIELRCEDLRLGSEAIGKIAGQVGVDDLLDVIFSQFCIGK